MTIKSLEDTEFINHNGKNVIFVLDDDNLEHIIKTITNLLDNQDFYVVDLINTADSIQTLKSLDHTPNVIATFGVNCQTNYQTIWNKVTSITNTLFIGYNPNNLIVVGSKKPSQNATQEQLDAFTNDDLEDVPLELLPFKVAHYMIDVFGISTNATAYTFTNSADNSLFIKPLQTPHGIIEISNDGFFENYLQTKLSNVKSIGDLDF